MHPFATDSRERRNVIAGAAFLSVSLGVVINGVLELISGPIPWVVGPLSPVVLFGIVYEAFDKRGWRLPIARRMGLVRVPDLIGRWEGNVTTSFDQHAESYPVTVTIDQRWTAIGVHLETERSESHSVTGCLFVDDPAGVTLSYEYRNDPKATAEGALESHRGTAVLGLKADNILEGAYYTGRGRQTHGGMRLQRRAS